MEYRTCTYIHDDGGICNSAAVTDRNLCLYHLRHRARLMRLAQYRARNQRFDLRLPPLESMHAVQSALNQLSEALAADMIELKRADRLIRLLNIASRNLLKADKWPASPYHSAETSSMGAPCEGAPPLSPAFGDRVGFVDLTAEFGLPNDLDLNLAPELAFPPPASISSDLSSRAEPPAFGGAVEGPALSRSPLFPEIPPPHVRDYTAEAEAALFEVTPQDLELNDILKSHGYKAMERRAREHQRDAERKQQRKLFRANYEHYAAVAKTKNIERAAEKLLAQRQAAEKASAAETASADPSIAGVEVFPSDKNAARKPPASAAATGETVAELEATTA